MTDLAVREAQRSDLNVRSTESLVERLADKYRDRITGYFRQAASPAIHAAFPDELSAATRLALQRRGITQLYSHQRAAWDAAQRGKHIVVVTPTASGKSLCYHLPVIEAVRSAGAKALYLFPTKALAQDQVADLLELNKAGAGQEPQCDGQESECPEGHGCSRADREGQGWPIAAGLGVRAYTFDGDTPNDARQAIRMHGDIVVSNPDMLHQAILPHHTKWAQFFENLRYVVIDELHTYRGVFGSHVANVMRRLKRVCAFYGVTPRFICCSATIGNPREHAEALIGEDVVAIDRSGAPRGERHLLLWNPPVINPDLGIRASSRSQASRIARHAIRAKLKTIVFAQSRLMVEVLTKYLKDVFDPDPRKPERIRAYRGGYLPAERRQTERALRAGSIDGVVTTSALELGVDIGSLDVAILNGYPGSIAASWQRLGRAGRRLRPSLGVLIASSQALDQYVIRHPEFFEHAPPETARIAPDQLLILLDHIRCAAFELPFTRGDRFGGVVADEFLEVLAESGVLHGEGDRWDWIADSYPAQAVSLRSVADGNFVVVDRTDGRQTIIAEVDYSSAALTLYEGAIYMIQSQPFQVETLDWEGRKAFVTRTQADYYTDAIDYTKLKTLERFDGAIAGSGSRHHGEFHVVRRVSGYKKIRFYSHENIGYGPVNLPDQELQTSAVWWQLEHAALARAFANRQDALDGFLGAAYALHTVASIYVMADARDLQKAVGSGDAAFFATRDRHGRGQWRNAQGAVEDPERAAAFTPTVYLYDNFPGGIGLSEPLFRRGAELVAGARELVAACSCSVGCPACVGPVLAADETSERSAKRLALDVLDLLA
jgi:DEAD/DEAH box helicase domain-containing protein